MSAIHKAIRQSVYDRLEGGRLDEAEDLCRESLLILEELCPVHVDVVTALCRLGWILDRRRAWAEALDCAERAREVLNELGSSIPAGQRESLLLDALILHGVALRQLGRYRHAEVPFQQAVRLAEVNHEVPELLISACDHLALNYRLAGNFEQAVCLYGLAILFARRAFGEVNALTATMCYHLAALQFSRGRFQDGLTPARQSLEMRRILLGPTHPDALSAETVLNQLQTAMEKEAKARPVLSVVRSATMANTVTLSDLCSAAL
ncbi:tetratricopeptide repeat protein [uncultured Paludibaculum sp.]|uniref:tetratricopeptide repeat protein n=1 Tax=uncultured Paludibaculum sp. TaxID=1765020 RepID=UPI002AAAD9EB|nr:tetratricopeptide repeat protein [uncultured Paludibaculum sp.]